MQLRRNHYTEHSSSCNFINNNSVRLPTELKCGCIMSCEQLGGGPGAAAAEGSTSWY